MNIHSKLDTLQKLAVMGDVTVYEPAGDCPQAEAPILHGPTALGSRAMPCTVSPT